MDHSSAPGLDARAAGVREHTVIETMERRKFLIGAGSLAAGSATVLGTSATTTFNLNDRGVGANVVADSNGAIRLADRTPENNIVNQNSSGELEIDFAEGNAGGVNIGSVVTIGNLSNPKVGGGDPAFTIENQATANLDLEVVFEAGPNYQSGGSELTFAVGYDGDPDILTDTIGSGVSSGGTVTIYDQDDTGSGAFFNDALKPGQRAGFALKVDADNSGSSTNDNLSGTLDITATQPETDN